MLSSLDTVGSLSDDTLLWPGRRDKYFHLDFIVEALRAYTVKAQEEAAEGLLQSLSF